MTSSLKLGLRLMILAFCAAPAGAQNYSIDWYTIGGGGGTSTGSVYTISGTIGQPAAGTLTGSNYSVTGGFWALIGAVQTPGWPLLSVFITSTTTVLVSWPSPSTGFLLQQNANVDSTN